MENENTSEQKSRFYPAFTAGLVIGLLGGILIAGGSSPEERSSIPSVKDTEGGSTLVTEHEPGTTNISVLAQEAGTTVRIETVSFDSPGWVAIHEDDSGKPGRILGAQLFDAGKNNGTVTLLRATVPGKTYYAALLSDNGDRTFDKTTDLPITVGGSAVIATFQTTLSAGIPIRNESSE